MLLAWLLMLTVGGAAAEVGLVLGEEGPSHQEFVARFRAALAAKGLPSLVIRAAELPLGPAPAEAVELFVTVGVQATEAVLRSGPKRPVLAVFVPRAAYAQLRGLANGQPFTAIFLDQPLERRLRLAALALPERRRLAAVLGPASAGELKALQAAAAERGYVLAVERIDREEELAPALRRVLAGADIYLALPDPVVLNANTAQSILLTTYRAQAPVVGYSRAYVEAGALLAVYSTPSQIAQQAAEIVSGPGWTALAPAGQYPRYFSVAVNPHVARSLGITLEGESVLLEKLKATGARE